MKRKPRYIESRIWSKNGLIPKNINEKVVEAIVSGIVNDDALQLKKIAVGEFNKRGQQWDFDKIFEGAKKHFGKVYMVDRKNVWISLAKFHSPTFCVEYDVPMAPEEKRKGTWLYFFLFDQKSSYFRYGVWAKHMYEKYINGMRTI